MVEAKKLVYADRARFYADPDFYQVPVEGLLSKAYAAKRRKHDRHVYGAEDGPARRADVERATPST